MQPEFHSHLLYQRHGVLSQLKSCALLRGEGKMSRVPAGSFRDNVSFKCEHQKERRLSSGVVGAASKLCLALCQRCNGVGRRGEQ